MNEKIEFGIKYGRNGKSICLQVNDCNLPLIDVLRAAREIFLEYNPQQYAQAKLSFRLEVYIKREWITLTPEEWKAMKSGEDYISFFPFISDTEIKGVHVGIKTYREGDYLVDGMMADLIYWNAFIRFLRKYDFITPGEKKELMF